MALATTILNYVLNLKYFVLSKWENVTLSVSRFNEPVEQKVIYLHGRPYECKRSRCPICRKKCPAYDYKHQEESKWRLPNLNGIPVYVCYRPRRIECETHGVHNEYIPWADGISRFTEDFNNEVAWLVTQMSKTAIATFLGINWRTVGNCVKAAHSRLEPDVSQRLHCGLKRICVDETSYRKGHSYITVVYDMDRNRVVWISEKHGEKVFEQFCLLLTEEERDAITVVAGDGARWIDSCTEKYFKNAKRCVDFFHVVEWTNEALDKVRLATASQARKEYADMKKVFEEEEAKVETELSKLREQVRNAESELEKFPKRGRPSKAKKEQLDYLDKLKQRLQDAEAKDKESRPAGKGRPRKESFTAEHQAALDECEESIRKIKGAKYALGKNPENRTANQDAMVELIQNSYPDLYKALQQKEELRIILHMKDADLALDKLDTWIQSVSEGSVHAMKELGKKIKRHKENILNAIRYQANSSQCESTNTTIKALIKTARGFRNLDNMIALIYLKCSDIVVPLNNRVQCDAHLKNEMRARAKRLKQEREAKKITGKKA